MILYNEKIRPILDDLENPEIELAGGSAVGMVLSITDSLISYICNLTIGKKKYENAYFLQILKSLSSILFPTFSSLLTSFSVSKESSITVLQNKTHSLLASSSFSGSSFLTLNAFNNLSSTTLSSSITLRAFSLKTSASFFILYNEKKDQY